MQGITIEVAVEYDGTIIVDELRDFLADALLDYEMSHPEARVTRTEVDEV